MVAVEWKIEERFATAEATQVKREVTAVKLLALKEMETEVTQCGQWESSNGCSWAG